MNILEVDWKPSHLSNLSYGSISWVSNHYMTRDQFKELIIIAPWQSWIKRWVQVQVLIVIEQWKLVLTTGWVCINTLLLFLHFSAGDNLDVWLWCELVSCVYVWWSCHTRDTAFSGQLRCVPACVLPTPPAWWRNAGTGGTHTAWSEPGGDV